MRWSGINKCQHTGEWVAHKEDEGSKWKGKGGEDTVIFPSYGSPVADETVVTLKPLSRGEVCHAILSLIQGSQQTSPYTYPDSSPSSLRHAVTASQEGAVVWKRNPK